MLKGRTLIGAILTFGIALICCVVLEIQVLHNDKFVKAGIATLRFNFTDIHLLNNPLLMPRSIPGRDVLQPLQSEAQSAANVVATDISPAISKAQSAASAAQSTANVVATAAISKIQSAASAATAINTVKEMIPRNCSLGTKQFCFGFYNRTECHNLPLNLSNIVPEAVATFVGDQVQVLEPLPWILANIQGCLILGLVLLILVMAVILCLAKCLLRLSICIGMVIIGVAGLLCCVPFAIPTFILFAVQSKIQNLPSNIEVQKGDVSYYCLGILFCGIIMTLSAILSRILV